MIDYLLDTNSLLRYLLNDIPAQSEFVARIFSEAQRGGCHITIPVIVVIETVYVLTKGYGFPKGKVADVLGSLLTIPYIAVEKRVILIETFRMYPKTNVSFVDLVLRTEAMHTEKKLITFDAKLNRPAKGK